MEIVVRVAMWGVFVALVALLVWGLINNPWRTEQPPPPLVLTQPVVKWHDPDLAVSCWIYRDGISCLPDRAFE
jgi:hypothetical protein